MGGEGYEQYRRTLNAKHWKSTDALVSRGVWVLAMVLVGYGGNDNRLRVWDVVN